MKIRTKTENVAEINVERRQLSRSNLKFHDGTKTIIGGHLLPSNDVLRSGQEALFGGNLSCLHLGYIFGHCIFNSC